jgi:hypothetical protein
MKPQHARVLPAAAACAALLSLALSAPPAAAAQVRQPQPHRAPEPTKPEPIPRAPSVRERQLMIDEMSREMGKGAAPRKSEELRMAEIAEDYRDLQQVNNKMMAAAMRAAPPDYKMVAGSLADIRKRAERLNSNLALPKSEKTKRPKLEDAVDPEQLRESLATLDKLIIEFAHNPVFRDVNIVDAELSAKARRELDEIIELSGWVKKNCEKLNKGRQSR